MELNADFTKRAAMHGSAMDWVASPMAGVDRRMLDRIGDEVARATSIVRYAPESHFSAHVHSGGEEYLVLEGTFQDEHGDFPKGTYVRNPPQSSHTPGSDDGCVIFVKLWQFDADDRTQISVDTQSIEPQRAEDRPGVEIRPLYRDDREDVRLEQWAANTRITLDVPNGVELLVLDGSFEESGETFTYQSWLRLPKGATLEAVSGPDGCTLWVKSGHLATAPVAPAG